MSLSRDPFFNNRLVFFLVASLGRQFIEASLLQGHILPRICHLMASNLSHLEETSPDDIPKSIIVSDITPGTKEEAIVIHFQQRKHGGGDVMSVKFAQDGDRAVITFEEEESRCFITK